MGRILVQFFFGGGKLSCNVALQLNIAAMRGQQVNVAGEAGYLDDDTCRGVRGVRSPAHKGRIIGFGIHIHVLCAARGAGGSLFVLSAT